MKKFAIGIMSGTSLDGIDVALASIEGQQEHTKITLISANTYQYDSMLLQRIQKAINNNSTSEELCVLDTQLAQAYSDCVFALCNESNVSIENIDFIASHGQTIFHITKDMGKTPSTLQLGSGSILANRTNCTVVSNFRQADIAKGGSGAPLVPFADYILFQSKEKTRLLQNIGGIANVTVLQKNGTKDDVYAFDNGPGNMMIDTAMKELYGASYDKDGCIAHTGTLIKEMFEEIMNNEYFKIAPPKSTGREAFGSQYTLRILNKYQTHKKEDIITTLTHVTAYSIAQSYSDFISVPIDEIIVSGGGAHNTELLQLLQAYTSKNISILEDYGYSSDYKEALAFIILANETLHQNPSNILGATGAIEYAVLGQVSTTLKKKVT